MAPRAPLALLLLSKHFEIRVTIHLLTACYPAMFWGTSYSPLQCNTIENKA